MKKVEIKDDYITLGQLLKHCSYISSGAEAKYFLYNVEVLVNGETELRRGRKVYQGDIVTIDKDIIHVS